VLTLQDIESLFVRRGAEQYSGEPVTQLEHALQCAAAAHAAHPGDDELLAAALLVPRVGAQEPWTTKKFMPRGTEDCQNSCIGFGDMFYNIHGSPPANAGELSKYNTLADAWTTGKCLARAHAPAKAGRSRGRRITCS
jgi:hypothetical protein